MQLLFIWLFPIVKASTTLSQCQTCETGYTPINIGDSKKCYKVIGRHFLDYAHTRCVKEGATLPLPKNSKENTDLYKLFSKIRQYTNERFVLDLNVVQNEGSFVSSNAQKQTFFNWDPTSQNNMGKDHVAMYYSGVWRHYAGTICIPAKFLNYTC